MKAMLSALILALAGTASAGNNDEMSSILGHLETKDRVVTLYAGRQPRYTVRTKGGKVLANKITASELRERYPDLYRINDATAVAWAGL
ncbi:MAG TPA: hypothetical protein VLZ12_06705 [Verrucomicrobiae bacterium]|nr:hypothetical protein [Verrucomicrobiae bacterium]